MSLNRYSVETPEVAFLKKDLDGLNDVYRDIADEIGVENALAIDRLFRGTQISFPSRLFSKEYTHKAIISEYDGNNIPQLAQKYNYSERSVWRILAIIKTSNVVLLFYTTSEVYTKVGMVSKPQKTPL